MSEPTQSQRLAGLVDVWWDAVDDFTDLLEALSPEQWRAPTDLAGWDVHAVAAHIAHLEALLNGVVDEPVDIGQPAHVTSMMATFTEQGVVARRDRSPDELINEIREMATRRRTLLLADPPTDGSVPAQSPFGDLGWSVDTLLRNRPLDIWMHEQDIRRAVGIPGNLDTVAAKHTADYLAESIGYVLAKKVEAPAGTTIVLAVAGSDPVAATVNEHGRGERLPAAPAEPTVRLAMDRETFIVLAGGRRTPEQAHADEHVTVDGDQELGRRILAALTVTP
ncbi:maleylpyruvate isomerase family mycothiol-dependent enzyme [Nocardioides pacificus]